MRYKVGDKVRIASKKVGNRWNDCGDMDKWLGKVMTIREIERNGDYRMYEDTGERYGDSWYWDDNMIAGLAEEEIHITRKGNEVIAVHKQGDKAKKAVAKCSPEDEFDFMVGAKLAFERLTEAEKPKFVPHLVRDGRTHLGNIGEETIQTAIFGEKLCVGDVVEIYATDTETNWGKGFVCKDGVYPNGFVMGLGASKFKHGIDREWQIRKVKSFKDHEHGEAIDGVKAVLREGK